MTASVTDSVTASVTAFWAAATRLLLALEGRKGAAAGLPQLLQGRVLRDLGQPSLEGRLIVDASEASQGR